MKQLTIFSFLAFFISSCGNNPQQTQTTEQTQQEVPKTEPADQASAPDPLKDNPDYSKGLELVAQSDCLTCHKIDDINVGPSYRDIAGKYAKNAKNISLLADKIVKGGSGVWGQVPMTPHPGLSKKDAEQMVKYILLLKKSS